MTRASQRNDRISHFISTTAVFAFFLAGLSGSSVRGHDSARTLAFERHIWPFISANCIACHGDLKPKAGLDLRTVAQIIRGGESGPAINKADPESSLMLQRVAHGEMPPGKARKLSADEI